MSNAPSQETQKRYQQALASLVEKLEKDRTVVAAILFGSLSYDEVWKNSDIDLWLIMEDGQKEGDVTLCEYDVNIHAQRIPRGRFKRSIEGDLAGGWLDFSFSTSTLLFTRDDSITQWYSAIDHIGARDQALQLMRHASYLIPSLNKAEKYFYLKEDYEYSFLWLTYVVRELASIEVILHNEAPAREVIHQALKHNPQFFTAVYTDFVNQSKTRETVEGVLYKVNEYLEERTYQLFRPLLDYLTESAEVRSLSEIDDYFQKKIQGGGLEEACEWLVRQDVIEKLSSPIHLTEKSRIKVEEPAYYYDEDAVELL
jgi:hypothetical protein